MFECCIFSGNSSQNTGGAVYSRRSEVSLENCTVVGNTSDGGGAFLCDELNNIPSITSSILWNDSPNEIQIESGQLTVGFCDVQGGWSGEGNIDLPPRFVDYPGGDLRLQYDSPCVDAGDPAADVPPGGACIVDMGALELWQGIDCGKVPAIR